MKSKKVLGNRSIMRFLIASMDWPTGFEKPQLDLVDDPNEADLVWAYLPLRPGTYCLWENPASLARKEKSYSFLPRGLRIQIDGKEGVFYLGTLAYHFEGKTTRQPRGMRFQLEWDDTSAKAVAAQQFGNGLAYSESPFESLDEVRSNIGGASPKWVIADRGNTVLGHSSGGGLRKKTSHLEGLLFWGVLYAPFVVGDAVAEGNRSRRVDRVGLMIEEELSGMDPSEILATSISEKLGSEKIASPGDTDGEDHLSEKDLGILKTLFVRLLKVSLRECADHTFCYEFTFRARILNPVNKRYEYEELFVYTNPNAVPLEREYWLEHYNDGQPMYPFAYETRLPGPSIRMKPRKFSGEGIEARTLLRSELENALKQVEEAIVNRISI